MPQTGENTVFDSMDQGQDKALAGGFGQIAVTPWATLRFPGQDASSTPGSPEAPWQEALLALAAERKTPADPVEAFWARLGGMCVRELCHAANPDEPSADEARDLPLVPLPEEAAHLLDDAPPMPGGEYLTPDALGRIWTGLLEWCQGEVESFRGLHPFLQARAPKWLQVGRVFFHLADNKLNQERPFVFLATYATGFNAKGELRHAGLSEAVKHYGEKRDVAALKRLLGPVQKAAEDVPWVARMLESKALFSARAWVPGQAYEFLKSAETLREDGIGVRLPDWWKKRPHPKVEVELAFDSESFMSASAIVQFDMRLSLGDEAMSREELDELLKAGADGLALFKGQWIEVDRERLQEALAHWEKVAEDAARGELTFSKGMRLLAGLDAGEDNSLSAGELENLREWSYVKAGAGFLEVLRAARGELPLEEENVPGLKAELRPYQKYGLAWMRLLARLGMGACLADDMGLGKTLQVIALMLGEREREWHLAPNLLVLPASLIANWKAELEKFAPMLVYRVLHPSEGPLPQSFGKAGLEGVDVVMTTYGLVQRLEWLSDVPWRRVILDEAQAIKNPGTKQSRAVRKLQGKSNLALTGTPIENSLRDLWSLFDFLNPGLLGGAREFQHDMEALKEKGQGLGPLRRVTAPYILRRLKSDKAVISSLPDKVETTLWTHLTKEQAGAYQQVADKVADMVRRRRDGETSAETGPLMTMQYIMLLKQICNHPAQAGIVASSGANYSPERSGKFQVVRELCSDIAARQEKVLVFTQFKEIIDPLHDMLEQVFGRSGLVLHGAVAVKRRGELVKAFQAESGPPFFILSLKAGGTGLNLTQASHVIHFDRWWNPAVEDQATDRAYRIGQKKNVVVHKCVTRGTLEERIEELMLAKRDLADEVLSNSENIVTKLSDDELLELVRLDLRTAVEE